MQQRLESARSVLKLQSSCGLCCKLADPVRQRTADCQLLLNVRRTQERLDAARSALACVQAACGAVRASDAFAAILRAVLAAGNTLNHGTARGNAAAIKLETLTKLADMKVGLPPVTVQITRLSRRMPICSCDSALLSAVSPRGQCSCYFLASPSWLTCSWTCEVQVVRKRHKIQQDASAFHSAVPQACWVLQVSKPAGKEVPGPASAAKPSAEEPGSPGVDAGAALPPITNLLQVSCHLCMCVPRLAVCHAEQHRDLRHHPVQYSAGSGHWTLHEPALHAEDCACGVLNASLGAVCPAGLQDAVGPGDSVCLETCMVQSVAVTSLSS